MPPPKDDVSAGSILRELIFNQYQAIVAGGAALASALTLNPLPLLLWLGSELVLLPILDSGPLRRLVARRRREAARAASAATREQLIASFDPAHVKRYTALEHLCHLIEANYQSLTGISQAYLAEQRGKLDYILDGCLHRMLAMQRYEKMPHTRHPSEIKREIAALEQELEQPELNDRARAALQKNLELKQRLLAASAEVSGTMKALATELDSMASLLEVLHQNSIALRDPQAIAEELDTIVRQSEDSEKVVREMEALLRSDSTAWVGDVVPGAESRLAEPGSGSTAHGASRQKVKKR
jgi:DNA repair exonuclease SbcCD ATPase subunit